MRRTPLFPAELAGSSDADLRSLLDTAMGVLQDLDKGSKTVLRCRDTLSRLVAEFDLSGARGKCKPSSYHYWGSRLLTLAAAGTDLGGAPAPGPFWLPPASAWAWQLTDPGLFGLDVPLDLVHDLPGGAPTSQFPGGLDMPPDS